MKSTLTIHSSKTDQEGKGESLYIDDPTRKAIKRYCAVAEIEAGALFRRIRRGQHITSERLSVVSARRIIKKWANAAGIEGFISGRSLRVGTAVSLAQSGATLVDMQTCRSLGRSENARALRSSGTGGTGCGGEVLLREVNIGGRGYVFPAFPFPSRQSQSINRDAARDANPDLRTLD